MNKIQPPENAVVSKTGVTWLDETGIIIAVGINHAIHTYEHALENHKINTMLADGIRRPFLIDMTEVTSMSQEARAFYAGPEPQKILTAVAILTTSNVGKIVANMFMALSKPVLPTRLFTDYDEAKKWLTQFL
ncbi:MAG: hypothetical protein K0Q79_3207 [Flavipsychrobacter sp.]|jgi:hypothetical protein|nr:hypothetical protein [Flavipsychrobacter sp.]